MAKLYIKTKQYDLSEKYLDTSYNVANDLKSIYYIQEINNAYASLYKAKGDYENYILSSEKMNQFILTNSINQKIAKSIDWINLNNKEKEVYRVKNKYLIFSLIVFCIVVITIILILKKYIDYKNKSELKLVTEFEVIENKRNEDNIYLNQLKSNLNINNHSSNDVDHSNTLLELKLLNEISNNWETYQLKFNAVFPNFFKNLNNLNQNLTDLDLKHASFIKLNLSTFEVANMLGINIQSVATFRYRLKQKLNLDKDVSLRSFLLSL